MNIIPLDITNGLNNHPIGAGEYIQLIDAPALANVTVKTNNAFGHGVPLKVGHSLTAKNDVFKVFISCDPVAGEQIRFFQADAGDAFILNSPASDVNVGTIEKIADKFRANGTAVQPAILAGAFYTFDKTDQKQIRFHASDQVGIELNGNNVKYPMYEEELILDDITQIKFHNNTAATITLTILDM